MKVHVERDFAVLLVSYLHVYMYTYCRKEQYFKGFLVFFQKNVINVYMHVEGGVTCTCTHAYHVVEENSSLLDERDYLTVFHVHV